MRSMTETVPGLARATPTDVASGAVADGGPPDVSVVRSCFLVDPVGTDLSSIRALVARSWKRSIAAGPGLVLDGAPPPRRPEVEQRLVDSAEPAIRLLLRETRDHDGCALVADRFGTLAAVRGGRHALRWAERAYGRPGTSLAEDLVGTNCVGTAIEEQCGATIAGAEHLSARMDGCWSSSALVRDPLRRSLRAVVGIALPIGAVDEVDTAALTALVDRAAAEIMDVLAARIAGREQALLTAYLRQVRKRGSGAVLAIDGRTTIASDGALELVGAREQPVLAAYAQEAQRRRRPAHQELSLGDGSTFDVHIEPVLWAGEAVGSVLDLRAAPGAALLGAPAARRPSNASFTGLVGQSPAFERVIELAQRAVERRMAAVVVGEAGTGKRTLALAMAQVHGGGAVCIDGDAGLDRGSHEEVARVLAGGGAVVVLHADRLPDAAWSDLAARVEEAVVGRLLVTARHLSDAAHALIRGVGGTVIEMPALRARRADVPALVSAFLAELDDGPQRVSSRLLRALTDADLPTNVAQLREIVTTAAARCSGPELGTDDLTAEHRQLLMRLTLSPLQVAEAMQIREALREAHGNRVRAAEILRIGRSSLYRRLDMYTRLGFQF